ncbi:MAG: hypothetical protein LC725_08820 [Lentisphaerae bacterium]|nr:hypothetical protein [Lentisphaerota bacterium]
MILIILLIVLLLWWQWRVIKGLERLRRQAREAWRQLDEQLTARQDWARELLKSGTGAPACLAELEQILAKEPASDLSARFQDEQALTATLNSMAPAVGQERFDSLFRRVQITAEFYNMQVLIYNTRMTTMSFGLPARLAGFRPMELFRPV